MSEPVAQELPAVSPSLARTLGECFLRVAYAQATPRAGERSDAQIVGDAAHAVLADLLAPGPPFEARLSSLRDDFRATVGGVADGGAVRRARPAAARLAKLAAHAVALAAQAGEEAEIRCEQRATARDGRLHGIIDLVIRSPTLHAIVDFKTGDVTDDDGELAGHFADQLAVYCVLEEERCGQWPSQALILRFGGAPIEMAVDAAYCREVADRALEIREEYLTYLGSTPPASPSAEACRYCPFAPRCEAFWKIVAAPDWTGPEAVRGEVVWAQRSTAGGITVKLAEVEGSKNGTVVVQRLASDAPGWPPEPGDRFAAVGLWADRDDNLNGAASTRVWIGP